MGSNAGFSVKTQEFGEDNLPSAAADSHVANFYANRSVFLTGATGFVGKGILEKLLRACLQIKNVYVLLRPKGAEDVKARLCKLLESSIFETLLSDNPGIVEKVIPICGDLSLPDLGINQESQEIIFNQVSIVINSAATVKFDEKLKFAFNINTMGTKRIVDLCKEIKNLVALVHVSTAYSNSDRRSIGEAVYPTLVNPKHVSEIVQWMSDDQLEAITSLLIQPKPNTYTFTKSLAEYLLSQEAETLPISIIRPSIVVATWKEPVAGWVDNFNSATGPIAANGMGVLRTLPCDATKMTDLSPLDVTVNLILAAAWNSATLGSKGISIYNCCSGNANPLSWGDLVDASTSYMTENPLSNALWCPDLAKNSKPTWYAIKDFIWHYLPTRFLHLVSLLIGKPKGMDKLYRSLCKIRDLRPFTTQDWKFDTANTEALFLRMTPLDQNLFNFNTKDIHWPTFVKNYCLGIRQHLFKQNIDTLPAARNRMKRLHWIRNCLRFTLTLMLTWAASRLLQFGK